jgi:hypothetical protein
MFQNVEIICHVVGGNLLNTGFYTSITGFVLHAMSYTHNNNKKNPMSKKELQ